MNTIHHRRVGHYCFLLVFALILITLFSSVASAELVITKLDSKSCELSLASMEDTDILNIHDLDKSTEVIRINPDRKESISIEGFSIELFEPEEKMEAILLPDDNIGLRLSDGNKYVVAQNCSVLFFEDNPILYLQDESKALYLDEYGKLSFDRLLDNTTISQKPVKLNTYEFKLTIPTFEEETFRKNTATYLVNWGDGDKDLYPINYNNISHTYRQSGTYQQTIKINDNYGYSYSLNNTVTVSYEGHLMHASLWIVEFQLPLLLLGLFGAGVSLSLVLSETGLYLATGMLSGAIPLYTRLDKEDVLDQFVRGQIYGYIKTNPGAHYNQIRRDIDVKNGTLAYHLRVLEKTDLIKSRKEGVRYRAFYPTGHKFPKKERFRLTDLQMRVLKVIKSDEGLTQKDIAAELHKKPQTINYNIKVLEKAGLIELKRMGRKSRCYSIDQTTEEDDPALA